MNIVKASMETMSVELKNDDQCAYGLHWCAKGGPTLPVELLINGVYSILGTILTCYILSKMLKDLKITKSSCTELLFIQHTQCTSNLIQL